MRVLWMTCLDRILTMPLAAHKSGAGKSCIGLLLVLAVFTSRTASGQGKPPTGEEVVARVQKTFSGVTTLSARFKHTFSWKLAGRRQESNGWIHIGKSGRFRLETDQQIVVSDGKTSWAYSPDNHQVVITPFSESDPGLSPRAFLADYTEGYHAEYLGAAMLNGRASHLIRLIPQAAQGNITELKVWVDKVQWIARKIEYTDVNGNSGSYVISRVRVNQKLGPSVFEFDIPKGAEVVDLRR